MYNVPTIYVLSKKKEKYRNFSAENVQILQLKKCLFLHCQAFVMTLLSAFRRQDHKYSRNDSSSQIIAPSGIETILLTKCILKARNKAVIHVTTETKSFKTDSALEYKVIKLCQIICAITGIDK